MLQEAIKFLDYLKDFLQFVGIIFIAYRSLHAIVVYILSGFKKDANTHLRFYLFKFELGRGIVGGLELIVAGDVVSTTLAQSYNELFKLIILVLIRILINFFLEKDLESIPEKDRIAIQKDIV